MQLFYIVFNNQSRRIRLIICPAFSAASLKELSFITPVINAFSLIPSTDTISTAPNAAVIAFASASAGILTKYCLSKSPRSLNVSFSGFQRILIFLPVCFTQSTTSAATALAVGSFPALTIKHCLIYHIPTDKNGIKYIIYSGKWMCII